MKRIMFLLLIGLIAITGYSQGAFAADQTATATVSATVAETFSIALNLSTLAFGSMAAGEFKELKTAGGTYHNEAVCKVNTGRAWALKINAAGDLTAGSKTIPVAKLQWMSTYAGSKNDPYGPGAGTLDHHPKAGYVPFTTTAHRVYLASGTDLNTLPNGLGIQFIYALSIPNTQAAGSYSTTVTYTLTETL